MFDEQLDEKLEAKIMHCPQPLRAIIGEFRQVLPRERLEYLLEYAEDLPDLPARLEGQRDQMDQVHECQTPVFLHTEIAHTELDGDRVAFRAFALHAYA